MSVTSDQLRMARAALKLTVRELADRLGVDKNTIVRIEAGGKAHASTLQRLRAVLEGLGIEFIPNGQGPGVRLKRET